MLVGMELVGMEHAWLGVVSAAHVRIGVAQGFAQVQHGKRQGLDRMRRGDGFVYYSPVEVMGTRTPLQAFTGLGTVADDETFQDEAVMAPGSSFRPFRRRVRWEESFTDVALEDVRERLDLTSAPNWGYALRRGLIPLAVADFERLREFAAAG
jgi:hypothetical protein